MKTEAIKPWKNRVSLSFRVGHTITEEERQMLAAFVAAGPFMLYIVEVETLQWAVFEPIKTEKAA